MSDPSNDLTGHLYGRIRLVLESLGHGTVAIEKPEARFGDLLDSMGLVELVAILAEDFGVAPEAIEQCVAGRFGTVAELAAALSAAGLFLGAKPAENMPATPLPSLEIPSTEYRQFGIGAPAMPGRMWLAATAGRLPEHVQSAAAIDAALNRPAGWLERHAGIYQRRVWADQDPLEAAAGAARECLQRAGMAPDQVGALLVTSEAPPVLAGLAAALHHRLGLISTTPALEIGGACTGFLAALWTAQPLVARGEAVLVIALEAPSRYLLLQPGLAGEAAALFGDGAAASLLSARPTGPSARPLTEVVLGTDGSQGQMIRVEPVQAGPVELHLDRQRLAGQAIRIIERSARSLVQAHGIAMSNVQAVMAHGGNGRMPALLARRLGLPLDRIWSTTPQTGNLGAASLPVAWAAHLPQPIGSVLWASVGAGICWGAALISDEER